MQIVSQSFSSPSPASIDSWTMKDPLGSLSIYAYSQTTHLGAAKQKRKAYSDNVPVKVKGHSYRHTILILQTLQRLKISRNPLSWNRRLAFVKKVILLTVLEVQKGIFTFKGCMKLGHSPTDLTDAKVNFILHVNVWSTPHLNRSNLIDWTFPPSHRTQSFPS